MKKSRIVLIVVASVISVLFFLHFPLFLGNSFFYTMLGTSAEIEIDSYRLCQDANGENIVIIKYLLKNEGKEPTALIYEGDFYVYQNGVSLCEYVDELPKECHYDSDDQYKNIKGGVEYYAEIAYQLESPDEDVEVEVVDYGLFDGKKQKVFKIA